MEPLRSVMLGIALASVACGARGELLVGEASGPDSRGNAGRSAFDARSDSGSSTNSTPVALDPPVHCAYAPSGDWVCFLDQSWDAGPCAFLSDGSFWVSALVQGARETLWFLRFDPTGKLLAKRAYSSQKDTTTQPLVAADMIALEDDTVVWVGQDCTDGTGLPSAEQPYHESCLDGLLVQMSAEGETLREWRYGTRGGLERLWGVEPAPAGGLYVAGTFHAPQEFGGVRVPSFGGVDVMAARLSAGLDVEWVRSWGRADHDLGDIRLASDGDGHVAVAAVGLRMLEHQGGTVWTRDWTGQECDDIAMDPQGNVVDVSGSIYHLQGNVELRDLPYQTQRLFTPWGTWVGTNRYRDQVLELTGEGTLLRSHPIPNAQAQCGDRGFCRGPTGALVVTSNIKASSDFGIFDLPLTIVGEKSFVLYLQSWQEPVSGAR